MRTKERRRIAARANPAGITISILLVGLSVAGMLLGLQAPALIVLGFATISFALALPVHQLPAAALIAFALLPTSYLDTGYGRLRGAITAAVILVAVWLMRLMLVRVQDGISRSSQVTGFISMVVLLALTLLSTSFSISSLWTLVTLLLVLAPNFVAARVDGATVQALWRAWVWIGLLLALFAAVESLLSFNPASSLYITEQKWSVYRVTTTLGHPLMNGMFFAVTSLVLGFGAIRRREKLAGLAALLCVVATALSGSRSSVIALGVGLVVWLLLTIFSARVSLRARLVGGLFISGAVVFALSNATLRQRLVSDEAVSSAQYREIYGIDRAWELFEAHSALGTGPGTALHIILDDTGFVLESAVIGTLVSLGVVGSVALVFLLVPLVFRAVRNGSFELVAAFAAYLATGYAFPLWETRPSAWVIVTFLIVLSSNPVKGVGSGVALEASPYPGPRL